MYAEETRGNTGNPSGDRGQDQLATRERQAGPCGVAERSVLPVNGDLDSERQQGFNFQQTTCNAVLQRQPVQKLHDDEGLLTVLADLVDGTDVRMIESERRTSFSVEAF